MNLTLVANKKKNKTRVAFKKNRQKTVRIQDLTKQVIENAEGVADFQSGERLSGKGDVSRYRTIITDDDAGRSIEGEADNCSGGKVLSAIGSNNVSVYCDGVIYRCTVRRVVRTLSRSARSAVVAGDHVLFTKANNHSGVIERVEPRTSTLSRNSRGEAHIIVSNVDQAVIVASVAEPDLKLGLIDRFLCSTEKGGIRGIICINKMDLCNPKQLQPIIGQYARLGYTTLLTDATTGQGIDELRTLLVNKETVFTGQSGVGKSSLMNAIQPGLALKTSHVSGDSHKGRHTTRTTTLVEMIGGGWIVDTPGIRQLQLWDVAKEELECMFIEFRPFVTRCRYPNCSHTHEANCGVRLATETGSISPLRYQSYLRIFTGDDSWSWALQSKSH